MSSIRFPRLGTEGEDGRTAIQRGLGALRRGVVGALPGGARGAAGAALAGAVAAAAGVGWYRAGGLGAVRRRRRGGLRRAIVEPLTPEQRAALVRRASTDGFATV